MIVGKATFLNGYFGYLEAFVGLMLIALGCFRLYRYFYRINDGHQDFDHVNGHHLAYGVGLVHGLAGSGALILLVMTKIESTVESILYLIIFGLGSVLGMLIAAGIFNLPFSKRMSTHQNTHLFLILTSSVLCIGYGSYVVVENLI